MKQKVYLETTIISYLTAWRSQKLVMEANQEATREWWEDHRTSFDLFVSEIVLQEAAAGDPDAASRRLEILTELPELNISNEARALAKQLLNGVPLPDKAQVDALHIAVAATQGMDFLLTWNCRHIANASFRHQIEFICRENGFEPPVICTPLELMET
jgi:hypothetical protein